MLFLLLALVVAGTVAFLASQGHDIPVIAHGYDLKRELASCSSKEGLDVKVYYDDVFSKGIAVFDYQDATATYVRRIDVIHLLLQFGHELDKNATGRLIIAHKGQKLFFIESYSLKELTEEYTYGNKVWAFNHLPERLKRMDGTKAYSTWEGGWLGVMSEQTKDLTDVISRITGV